MKKLAFLMLFLLILLTSISFAAPLSSTTHVYFNGKQITSIDSNSTRLYYHQDYLGSTRIVLDKNGAQLARIDYEPFGRELVDTTKTKYTFTGKEQDATGLQYFGARYYDSDTGRFTQVDPSYKPAESPYVYANNNPLKLVDPDGKEPVVADGLYYLWRIPDKFNPANPKILDAQNYVQKNLDAWISRARSMDISTSAFDSIKVVFESNKDVRTKTGDPGAFYHGDTNTVSVYKLTLGSLRGGKWEVNKPQLENKVMHELIHAYLNTRRGELLTSGKQFILPTDSPLALGSTSNLMEGISDYYASKITGVPTDTLYTNYFDPRYAITSRYNKWNYIVNPIIDRFGGAGRDWILMHGMSENEAENPALYQQRAIGELGASRDSTRK